MKAKIIIEINEKLLNFMMKSDNISSVDELKGYLKGLWRENAKDCGEQVKISVEIEKMTDIEWMEKFQKIQEISNTQAIEREKRIAEVEAREMEAYGIIIRKLTAKDILQKLVDNFENINSESISTLAKEYGVKVEGSSNKVMGRLIDVKVNIETLDWIPETTTTFNSNLVWQNNIPKDKFSEWLDGSLKGLKETILSCLYGENNERTNI